MSQIGPQDAVTINRLHTLVARLAVAVTILVVMVAVCIAFLFRSDEAARREACQQAITLRFLGATVRVFNIDADDRDATIKRLVTAAEHLEIELVAGTDPCAIELPDIIVEDG